MKQIIALIFVAGLFVSCKSKTEETVKNYSLGKYVYVDDMNVHHANSNCTRLKFGNDDDGHRIYAKHPMDTTNFIIENPDYFRVCSRCVDDGIYERLLSISNRNMLNTTMPGVEIKQTTEH